MRGVLFLSLLLSGCVGGTLSDTKDVELFPLRAASEDEAKELKHCLQEAYKIQENHKKETGHYYRKTRDMEIGNSCPRIMLSQHGTRTGYEIVAQINKDETTVRWSVNQAGVIEEHLDPEYDSDMDF